MNKPVSVSVVIVNWNVADSLNRCLQSLAATKYPVLEVIVIENNSSDKSLSIVRSIRKRFSSAINIRLIINNQNIGFPKAVNQGLKIASGDFLVLLNPDTTVPSDFITSGLSFFASHPTAAMMGPKFMNPDGTAQGSVFHEPSLRAAIREFWLGHRGLTGKYSPDEDRPVIVDAVSGACMFFPRSTLDKIGFLTEEVFMYYEDLDFCRRIRHAGLRVYFNPEIEIVHEHGQSSVKTSRKKYSHLVESAIYPLRRFFHLPNNLPGTRRYQTEAGIWYHGWFKNLLITLVIWTGQKFHRSAREES